MKQILCIVILAISLGCGVTSNKEGNLPLPSGKQIVVISVVKTHYPNGEYAVELNYRTNISIADGDGLKKEINDVWSQFCSYAEKQGATSAIIRAHEPSKGLIIKTNNSEAFLFKKTNGKWEQRIN